MKGMTSAEWLSQFGEKVPLWGEVTANYDEHKERFRLQDFKADQQLAALLGEQKSKAKK